MYWRWYLWLFVTIYLFFTIYQKGAVRSSVFIVGIVPILKNWFSIKLFWVLGINFNVWKLKFCISYKILHTSIYSNSTVKIFPYENPMQLIYFFFISLDQLCGNFCHSWAPFFVKFYRDSLIDRICFLSCQCN